MSLKSEISAFIDVNNLVSPQAQVNPTKRESDNGVLFTSEYNMLLALRKEDSLEDSELWELRMNSCMLQPGLLSRAPNDHGQEGPDDVLGFLGAAKVLNRPILAQQMLNYGYKHLGWFNNEIPGSLKKLDGSGINWQAFQWRQLQILGATWGAAGKLSWYKFWQFPTMFYTAMSIALSCINTPLSAADPRILSWCLIKATSDSLMCRLAAKLWTKRLMKDFPNGMKDVFTLYFPENHPLRIYMVQV